MKSWDVIVIGGGPAGSTAARRCARLGLRTLLIDKATFPRPKPCGGGVSEPALASLDFPVPDDLVEKDVFGVRLRYGDRPPLDAKRASRIAVLVSRSRFDDVLLEKAKEAGAEIVEGERIALIEMGDDDAIAKTAAGRDFAAKIIIGADGAMGTAYKAVRAKDPPTAYGVCVEGVYVADNKTIDDDIFDLIEVTFGVAPTGYGWVFPHDGYFSVGVGGLAQKMQKPKAVFEAFARSRGFDPSEIKARGHTIPMGGVNRPLAADRILLAGDAAGFVDTFLGEGIAYAIRSGRLAAETAHEAIKVNDGSKQFLERYAQRCEDDFLPNLRHSRWMTRLLHRYPDFLLRVFSVSPSIVNRFLEVPVGKMTYREFLLWLAPRFPAFAVKGLFK